MENQKIYTSENFEAKNRAFLYGDAVKVSFFVRNSHLILTEDCYFFLMASMRKMRMRILPSFTLEFFQNLFAEKVTSQGIANAIIELLVYRNSDGLPLQKSGVSFYFEIKEISDITDIQKNIEMDIIKEITVNTNLLSNIRVHCPENVYAEIYAKENDLDDVILLNPTKKVALSIYGNLLLLEGDVLKLPRQTDGAYISPLMESFITSVHKNNLAEIRQTEIVAFESQKAEEILSISDEKGIFSVTKIRNKTFSNIRFSQMLNKWKATF